MNTLEGWKWHARLFSWCKPMFFYNKNCWLVLRNESLLENIIRNIRNDFSKIRQKIKGCRVIKMSSALSIVAGTCAPVECCGWSICGIQWIVILFYLEGEWRPSLLRSKSIAVYPYIYLSDECMSTKSLMYTFVYTLCVSVVRMLIIFIIRF